MSERNRKNLDIPTVIRRGLTGPHSLNEKRCWQAVLAEYVTRAMSGEIFWR